MAENSADAENEGGLHFSDRSKTEAAKDIAGRIPMRHFWDSMEPRLLVVEAELAADSAAEAERKKADGLAMFKAKAEEVRSPFSVSFHRRCLELKFSYFSLLSPI